MSATNGNADPGKGSAVDDQAPDEHDQEQDSADATSGNRTDAPPANFTIPDEYSRAEIEALCERWFHDIVGYDELDFGDRLQLKSLANSVERFAWGVQRRARDGSAIDDAYKAGWYECLWGRQAEEARTYQTNYAIARDLMMTVNKKGDSRPMPCGSNVELILSHCSELADMRWNVITRSIEVPDGPFVEAAKNGTLDVALKNWLEKHWGLFVSRDEVGAQLLHVAQTLRSYDPVEKYLDSLAWDGKPRIDTWLTAYCGVDDNAYVRKVGARWLISGAARGLDPGCKVDTMLILQGPQGYMKSTTFAVLGGDYFSDSPLDLGNKDSRISASCNWIIELAELAALGQKGLEAQKAFLSASIDKVRPPYGRADVTFNRHCVFAGTTNPDEFLIDSTGNRRYWVACVTKPIDIEALRRDRNQLWAEAVHRYRDGEAWWFDHDEQVIADEVTEHHRAEHAWADPIRTWWSNLAANKRAKYEAEGFALADVAVGALQLTTDQLDHKERAIGRALRDSGFELTKTGRERVRRWFKKRAL